MPLRAALRAFTASNPRRQKIQRAQHRLALVRQRLNLCPQLAHFDRRKKLRHRLPSRWREGAGVGP